MIVIFVGAILIMSALLIRLAYLMIEEAPYYQEKATVCTVSVIHNQISDAEQVIHALEEKVGIEEEKIRKKVEKISSMEKVKSNVPKEICVQIRELNLDGVKVDDDFKRVYPFDELASKVIGFTGGDNQGIIGLEVKYESFLKGENGTILTTTDARGIQLEGIAEDRIEPISGDTLQISLDYNIQKYAQQMAEKVMEQKQAEAVQNSCNPVFIDLGLRLGGR